MKGYPPLKIDQASRYTGVNNKQITLREPVQSVRRLRRFTDVHPIQKKKVRGPPTRKPGAAIRIGEDPSRSER